MRLTPEPYQGLARDFLLERDRAALFVGMGMGKSAIILMALNRLFIEGAIRRALVVAPLRVANLTWPNEVAKWDETRWMRVHSLRKGHAEAEIHTINYESLHKIENLSEYDVIIFDELTRAKSPTGKRVNAFRKLLTPLHRRWGLTGTPRPNSLLELFAQVRLLDDGIRLSPSFSHFRNTYFAPTDYMEYNWEPKPGAEEKIYAKIHDLALTLRSSDYLDLPDTIVEDIEVTLPPEAEKIYKKLEKELLVTLGKSEVVAQNAAVLVNKLLQVCGGTVYDETRGVVRVHEAKIKALRKLLSTSPMENVLIATNYVHERETVCANLGSAAVDAAKFKGDIEKEWNSGRIKFLVADPRSLGHGLNLQDGGRTIVWFSPTWSREYYDQFNARLARKGQDKQPLIFRLIVSGTMDDAVIESLREKGEGQSEMLRVLTNFRLMKANP